MYLLQMFLKLYDWFLAILQVLETLAARKLDGAMLRATSSMLQAAQLEFQLAGQDGIQGFSVS